MDFGRVANDQLNALDLRLPKEPYWNSNIIKGKGDEPKAYVGFNKWGRKEWIGKLYPRGTKDAHFLDEYQKHFNSIEFDTTHYTLPTHDQILKWKSKVEGKNFIFCPKAYQGITHFGNLSHKVFLTTAFLDTLKPFETNLGPVFFQMSDKFGPKKRKEELFAFLDTLPKELNYFLEVRHPDWFLDSYFNELLYAVRKLSIGLVITDTVGRRDCCHMHLTVPKTFVRFVSNDGHPTDYSRLDDWIKRIKYWIDQGLRELYFFIHGYAFSPEISQYFIAEINKECGLKLPEIKLISNQ